MTSSGDHHTVQRPRDVEAVVPISRNQGSRNLSRLERLPTEILLAIFWFSHELSLTQTSHTLRSLLPAYRDTAAKFAILAFCEAPDLPEPEEEEIFLKTSPAVLDASRSLPDAAGLDSPLSTAIKAQLQRDVLTSHWFSVRLFYAVHRFMFQQHITSLKRNVQERAWADAKSLRRLDRLIQLGGIDGRSESTENYFRQLPHPDLITPGIMMPSTRLEFRYKMRKALDPNDHSLFGGSPLFEAVTVSITQKGIHFNRSYHMPQSWEVLDIYHPIPRTLLSAPFTPRKRGIVTYLLHEATRINWYPGSRANLEQAIIDAIPVGDKRFLRLLLDMTSLPCKDEISGALREYCKEDADPGTPTTTLCRTLPKKAGEFYRAAILAGEPGMLEVLFTHFVECDVGRMVAQSLRDAEGVVELGKLLVMQNLAEVQRRKVKEHKAMVDSVDSGGSSGEDEETEQHDA